MFTTLGYEPLRNLAVLTVAAVVSAQWALRDKVFSAEQMRKAYLKMRGIPEYEGRHRS